MRPSSLRPLLLNCALPLALTLPATTLNAAPAAGFFPDDQVPRFNVPRMAKPPVIDGVIDPTEWQNAMRVMGMAYAHTNSLCNRPHAFYVAWDDQHLYLAGHAHLMPGHVLGKTHREKYTTSVVFDDAFEFGIGLMGRNRLPGEAESYFKFILNYLASGEYMKMYPSIGQYLYNWRPEMKIANQLHDTPDGRFWDIEVAMDLNDLQMPRPHQAGDAIKLLLAHDGKNPGWVWAHVPSNTGYLVHTGFPTATLTADQPYVQVERLAGLDDEKVDFKSAVYNPTDRPVKVKAVLQILNNGQVAKQPANKVAVSEEKILDVPPRGVLRFDVAKEFPGLDYRNEGHPKYNQMLGEFDVRFTLADAAAGAVPVFTQHLVFRKDAEKKYLQYTPTPVPFQFDVQFNPVSGALWVTADTLDAQLPAGATAAAMGYTLKLGDKTVHQGRSTQLVYQKFQDFVPGLPTLVPGKYQVVVNLEDKDGKVLLSRTADLEKKDEAKAFPQWWGNRIGNVERVMPPFEPLQVKRGAVSKTAISCVRRTYEFDSLGLPLQVQANAGPVLAAPARIKLIVAGREYTVPTTNSLTLTERKDWRIDFTGAPAEIAGVRFATRGWIEQDGLVSLELKYEPTAAPVAIQELWIEWPVDDTYGNHVACMGVGGNYSARSIGRIPDGQGVVWDTLKNIGQAGSGMTVGNFFQNLWIGTEFRGLLWYGTSDEGWVPNDAIAAHDIVRDGRTTAIRNHLIGTYPGKTPFELAKARTVKFSYNASPFKALPKGWRVNLRSAANGFSGGKYKVNWDTNQDYFSILSPPFADQKRWPEYYAFCKEQADGVTKARGLYDPGARLIPYTCNQIAVRGYMEKTVEPGLYGYFGVDWSTSDSGETLNPSYRDYMTWLMDKQVREGGCRHFYFDISMCGRVSRAVCGGFGYLLPDGRIQPSGTDWPLREWYKRTYAMMLENGLWPTGVSGHCTNTVPLVVLPFSDALLDSEFPMKDPINVYPSDRMIALSCPENFGCNINHLGFMNPDWAAFHDAGMGGGHGSAFDRAEWRNWGIARADVQFVPYWRNGQVVRRIGNGLIASIWKRPGSAIIGVMNYGLDAEGFEKTRPAELVLDLAALGVPANATAAQVRIRDIAPGQRYDGRRVNQFKWYDALPGTPAPWDPKEIWKDRPKIAPQLDRTTGSLTGFDIFYHDQYYLVLSWDEKPVAADAWAADFPGDLRTAVLDWGIATAQPLDVKALAESAVVEKGGVTVQVWKRPGSVLLKLTNPGKANAIAHLKLDLAKLGVQVTEKNLWNEFTQIFALDGGGVDNVYWPAIEKEEYRWARGNLCFDGGSGKLVGLIPAGKPRVVCIDKY